MWKIILFPFIWAWAVRQGREKLEEWANSPAPDIQFRLFGLEVDIFVRDVREPPESAPDAKFLAKVTVGGKKFYLYRLVRRR